MKYDVVIIGCGPAAMFHALYLKKYGIENICMINKNNHHFHKACSGYFTQKTVTLLEELNISAEQDLGYRKGTDLIIHHDYSEWLCLNENDIYLYFPPCSNREDLDNYLYERIQKENITLLENTKIEDIDFENKKLKIKEDTCLYNYLVFADGFVGLSSKYQRKPKDMQIGFEVKISNTKKLKERADLNFKITKKGYAWIFTQEKYTTIGFTDLYDKNNNYLELLKEFASKKGYTIDEKNIKGAFIPRRVQNLSYCNALFIGDAAGLVDSLTQEGIYYAVLSAKEAVRAIKENNIGLYRKNMKLVIKELNASRKIATVFYNSFISKRLWKKKNKTIDSSFRIYLLKKVLTGNDFSYQKINSYLKEYRKLKKGNK